MIAAQRGSHSFDQDGATFRGVDTSLQSAKLVGVLSSDPHPGRHGDHVRARSAQVRAQRSAALAWIVLVRFAQSSGETPIHGRCGSVANMQWITALCGRC